MKRDMSRNTHGITLNFRDQHPMHPQGLNATYGLQSPGDGHNIRRVVKNDGPDLGTLHVRGRVIIGSPDMGHI